MTANTQTPRTDAAAIGFARLLVDHGTPENPKFETTEILPADFARELERELATAKSEAEALRENAAIGAIVWKFIDRMKDVAPECGDPAERILGDFVIAVTPAIDAVLAARKG